MIRPLAAADTLIAGAPAEADAPRQAVRNSVRLANVSPGRRTVPG